MQGISCDCRLLTLSTTDTFKFIFQNLTTPNLELLLQCSYYSSEAVDYYKNILSLFGVVLQRHSKILDAGTYNSLLTLFGSGKIFLINGPGGNQFDTTHSNVNNSRITTDKKSVFSPRNAQFLKKIQTFCHYICNLDLQLIST